MTSRRQDLTIWVICETRAGKILPASLELIGEASRLTKDAASVSGAASVSSTTSGSGTASVSGEVSAVFIAASCAGAETGLAMEAEAAGSSTALFIEGNDSSAHAADDDAYARQIAAAAERENPDIMLMAATGLGRSVFPRAAALLKTGLTADCTALRIEAGGALIQTRPAYGANLLAEVVCEKARPQMATVRPGVFRAPARATGHIAGWTTAHSTAVIRSIRTDVTSFGLVRLLSRVEFAGTEGIDLADADIVVAGGKGVGSAEGFALLERLAFRLGGAVAASRSAVEAGYAPYARQVGQTGRTVRPKLYIACGISGSVQHLAGMSGAACVIAINADPEAPIFDHADYGIVGDLRVTIAMILDILESRTGPERAEGESPR